ncbi:MAG: DUF6134 family protein [Beijerinckiaceae bacterium]|nr:DUF6134 family protein [Beijerinckiaceae bacterium]
MKAYIGAVMFGALAAGPAFAGPPAADVTTIHRVFDIQREGSPIGTNTLDLSRQGDITTVKVATHILVKVLFVNAYRYEHSETASFRGNELVSFSSTTDDNGTTHKVDAYSSAGKLVLKVDGDASEVPKDIYPAIIFSPDIGSKSLLFDPGNGKRLSAKAEDLGKEHVPVHGAQQELRHIKVSGQFDRDLWFDRDGLVKMTMLGSDHSKISSELRLSTAER